MSEKNSNAAPRRSNESRPQGVRATSPNGLRVYEAPRTTNLRPGDEVRDEQGNVVFKVDAGKKKQSIAASRKLVRQQQASRPLAPPKKSERTKDALAKLERRNRKPRARGVVKHDFGLVNRAERIAKRTKVLTRNAHRRQKRRAQRHAARAKSTAEAEWDAQLSSQPEGDVGSTGPGESWWGGVLDSALQLAPHIIPLVAGLGDYEEEDLTNQAIPRSNSLAAAFSDGEMCNEVPAIHNLGAETRFTHREYLGDVYSTTGAFTKVDFAVNPGMDQTFPWASRSILNYEQYQLQGAMFCFNSEGSDYAAGPGLGYVALGSQYDVAEPAFASKKEMFQSQFSVARKPSKNFAHWIECDPGILVLPKKFVRGGPPPTGSDIHLYDHCRTTLAVGGQATPGVIIGELWLTYDVLAMLPRTDENLNHVAMYSSYQSTGGVTQATPYGTSWVASNRNTFPLIMGVNTVTFPLGQPEGDYLIIERWGGTGVQPAYAVPAITGSQGWGTFSLTGLNGTDYVPALGSLGPSSMSRSQIANFAATAQGQWSVSTAQLAGPSAATYVIVIMQIPKQQALSSPIFDPLGREADERYERMLEAYNAEDAAMSERETSAFRLTVKNNTWLLVDRGADKSRALSESEARYLATATSDRLFDVAAIEMLTARERG